MADPTVYEREFDFEGYQSTKPRDPLPGNQVNSELDDIADSIGETIDALADIRRSDGRLQNKSVDIEQLADNVLWQLGIVQEVPIPPGPQGPAGPAGPAGPPGPSIYLGTVADLAAATIANDVTFVVLAGFYAPGDGGGQMLARRASEPTHPGKYPSANGVWFETAEELLKARQFGAKADDYVDWLNPPGGSPTPTDNTVFFQRMFDTSLAKGLPCTYGPGFFWHAQQTYIPTATAAGTTWSKVFPFRLWGAGAEISRIRYTGPSFALCHRSMEPSHPNYRNNRTQYGPVEIAYFSQVGPQNYNNPAKGIGLDNCTAPQVHHIWSFGWTGRGVMPSPVKAPPLNPPTTPDPWDEGDWNGGTCIVLRGLLRGGTYGGDIHENVFGSSGPFYAYSKPKGTYDVWGRPEYDYYTVTDIRDLELWCNRTCISLLGEYTTAGKANDVRIYNNRFQNPLVCAINARGMVGDRRNPIVGSTANLMLDGNEFFAQMPGRIEEGVIAEQIDATHFRLRQDPDTIFPYPDGQLNLYRGMGIKFTSGAAYAAAYITDMTADRIVTVDRAITNYVVDSGYMIQYADQRSRLDVTPCAGPHGVFHANQYAARSFGDYYERITPVVAYSLFSNTKFSMIDPNPEVNQGVQFVKSQIYDGNGDIVLEPTMAAMGWWPQISFTHTPGYADGQLPAGVFAPSVMAGNTENIYASAPFLTFAENGTGTTLKPGDVIRVGSNTKALTSASYLNATPATALTPHRIVWGILSTVRYPPNALVPIVVAGRNVPVNVTAPGSAVDPGARICPTTGQVGVVVPAADVAPTFTDPLDASEIAALNKALRAQATSLGVAYAGIGASDTQALVTV